MFAALFGWFGEPVKVYGLAFSSVGAVIVTQFTAPPVQSAAEQTVYVRGPQSLFNPFKTSIVS